jgi:tRNA-splicing ligase RtcB
VGEEFRGEHKKMGTEDCVWGLIHTGSRNLGKQLADYYHALAVEQCKKWYSNIPSEEYAFLPIDSEIGQRYLRDMCFALEYALENRKRIAYRMQTVLQEYFPDLVILFDYDIHHNYASIENHFGHNVWVHRKGATSAKRDEIGIIPGSMGTASYIVKGLGNPDSFMSCSHGAGRKMSRSVASQTLTEEECNKAMEGIVCERWSRLRRGKWKGQIDLSEAPGAYKDIEEVIANEADLVTPIVKLTPLAVLKG